jgi:hypothetical protein
MGMRNKVRAAIEELGEGCLWCLRSQPTAAETWRSHRAPDLALVKYLESPEFLADVHHQSLGLAFRFLFLFFAESRGLLPTTKVGQANHQTLDSIRDEVIMRSDDPEGRQGFSMESFELWDRTRRFLTSFDRGPKGPAPTYGVATFAPPSCDALDVICIDDHHLSRAIDLLSRNRPHKNPSLGRPEKIAYHDLDVRRLGDLYEGMLDYTAKIAEVDLEVTIQGSGEKASEQYLPLSELSSGQRRHFVGRKETANRAIALSGKVRAKKTKGSFLLVPGGRKSKRKSSGSYYTPNSIVQYIVEQALDHVVRGEDLEATPTNRTDPDNPRGQGSRHLGSQEVLQLKILDPAMGSGHFLVASVEYLARSYGEALIREGAIRADQITDAEQACHRRIVAEHCIYGVDVNPMAVELAKWTLWLFIGDRERPLSFLDRHLKCGNSLLGDKLACGRCDRLQQVRFSFQESEPGFNWELAFPDVFLDASGNPLANPGFDLVVGNPPYLGQKGNKDTFAALAQSPSCVEYFEGKMDLWYFFAEVGLDLCKSRGHLSYLCTEYWSSAEGATKLRRKVLDDSRVVSVHYFNGSVFPGAPGIHSQILLLQRDGDRSAPIAVYSLPAAGRDGNLARQRARWETDAFEALPSIDQAALPDDGAYFSFKRAACGLRSRTAHSAISLGEVFEVRQGIVPGFDKVTRRLLEIAERLGLCGIEPGASIFVLPADYEMLSRLSHEEAAIIRQFSYADRISRFEFYGPALHRLIYSSTETVNDLSTFPRLESHLRPYMSLMSTRRETAAGSKPWFHLHWPRTQALFESSKIVAVRQTSAPRFAYVAGPIYFDLAVNVLVASHLPDCVLRRCALVLNSSPIAQWLRENGKMKGEMFQVDQGPLTKVPIPRDVLEGTALSYALDRIWELRALRRMQDEEVLKMVDDALS